MDPDDLLTTGQAAELLHCSRQHIVDLCDNGTLPHQRHGKHRRIRRADLEHHLHPPLRRETEQSLWLHHALAAKLILDPTNVIERAKERLRTLRNIHTHGRVDPWFDQWEQVLNQGPHAVLTVITSPTEWADTMRSTCPLKGIGLLTDEERLQVRAAFKAWWRTTHKAGAA